MSTRLLHSLTVAVAACLLVASTAATASSHREAPFITELPKVDNTDFYMFRSYEDGREGFVTIIANYLGLQDAYGGPNYFTLDPNALYEIKIDNDGDAVEDITYQFNFTTIFNNIALDTGADDPVTIPFVNSAPDGIGPGVDDLVGVNRRQEYQVTALINDRGNDRGNSRGNSARSVALENQGNAAGDGAGDTIFRKPIDNIGNNSINGDYSDYSLNHVYGVQFGDCQYDAGDGPGMGRVFAGQRKEGFVINLGEVFDLINLNPLDGRSSGENIIADKNITSLALEVPIGCLTADDDPVIGGWATASLRQNRTLDPLPDGPSTEDGERNAPARENGRFIQVSRLAAPLVNEVIIGIDQKDRFNHSEPVNDPQFLDFVTNPTLPVIANLLFGTAIPEPPRNDLVAGFLTGVPGLNQPQAFSDSVEGNSAPGELLRLNTAIPATPPEDQNDLGFLGCDLAGFPNGRRPVDDEVDIALTVGLGAITAENPNSLQTCDLSGDAPAVVNAGAVVNDGARAFGPTADTGFDDADTNPGDTYLDRFPYLNTPFPGSPNEEDGSD